jgi:lysophospholipase L1-like esterase
MKNNVAGFSFVNSARFMDDDSLALYATYKVDGITKTARFILSNDEGLSQLDYLALGDSYISGEGAFDYMAGTDTNLNNCHLSYVSYPLLAGKDLNYNSYHSVACSGATTVDVTDGRNDYISQADKKDRITRAIWDETGQSDMALSSFLPGYVNQLEFVKRYQPKAVTISIGGNDAGLIGTLKTCFAPGACMATYEDRLEFVQNVKNHLNDIQGVYTSIKKAGPPDMRVYAVGYPQVAKPGGDCGLNVQLNSDEILFASQAIDYLNSVIKAAAARAGVFYVDAGDALYGHRLCEAKPGSVAVNGITAGNDRPDKLGGPIGNESFHPNAFGHELLENRILESTHDLTAGMPTPDPDADAPSTDGLEILDAPHSGRPTNTTEYDDRISDDLAYKGVPLDVSINGAAHSLPAGTNLSVELHTTVVDLGGFATDANGDLNTQVTIPNSVPAGYHTLHFYGKDIIGQPVDIYKIIYVAGTADDLDGDGIADVKQECVGVEPAGEDTDQDGIDDACDGDISLPPDASISSSQPTILTAEVSSRSTRPVVINSPAQSQADSASRTSLTPSPQTAVTPKVLGASTNTQSKDTINDESLNYSPSLILIGVGLLLAVSFVIILF